MTARKCLFCPKRVPKSLAFNDMTLDGKGWYANGLDKGDKSMRFYVCPEDHAKIPEAWEWAREEIKKCRPI